MDGQDEGGVSDCGVEGAEDGGECALALDRGQVGGGGDSGSAGWGEWVFYCEVGWFNGFVVYRLDMCIGC